jgi:predicted enzyme related to lactoylglutathione lyase
MVEHHGSFVWYELMTTDMAAAATFYANVACRCLRPKADSA